MLGEAASQVDSDLKERFEEVSWALPVRLRNRIIHGYWSIDLEIIHTTATDQLPTFTDEVREVLRVLESQSPDD